jgi:2-polyprenyl-3-methyl-5-hydroxy-6-metoxy-1,4-benzoquinol methylase
VILRPRGLRAFLSNLKKENISVLDVGCGNRSSLFIKNIIPKSDIIGIDIQAYNQTAESKQQYARYLITPPENFDLTIRSMKESFDVVISNHNIEHCNNPSDTFRTMIDKLVNGGQLFIATPSIRSINFPSRDGTLNFYDDKTHIKPIDLMKLFRSESHRIQCIYYTESSRPFFWRIVGWFNEYFSDIKNKTMLGTWDYYGFEQIIWIKKY